MRVHCDLHSQLQFNSGLECACYRSYNGGFS